MITEPGLYKLKEEFFVINDIPMNQYKTRRNDLLEWWKDFYDYEIIGTKPIMIKITEVFGEYEPLPRKVPDTAEKIADYNNYVKEHLPKDFQPESKAHMARGAIKKFGKAKYHHTSDSAVARNYVGPAMEKYGEKSEEKVWVDFYNYEELTNEQVRIWKEILKSNHLGDKELTETGLKALQKQDISKEQTYYISALDEAFMVLGVKPIRVSKWRIAAMRGLN